MGQWFRDAAYAFRQALREARSQRELRSRFPDIVLGEGVIVRGVERFFPQGPAFLDHRAYLNCAGGEWSGNTGFIRLGRNAEIGPYCVLWGAGGITIGDNVHLGAHVAIAAHEAHQIRASIVDWRTPLEMEFGPVVVEDHTLIASGAVIVPGVRIGHHCMVGAGSVVVDDIPPYSLAVGCPAKVIKKQQLLDPAPQSA